MSRTYQGSFITKTPITPSGPFQCGAASGVWTIDQMVGWQKAGLWPTAGNAFGTVGIFVAASFSNYQKYTFASCTISSGASICSPPSFFYGIAAAGTVNFGIFQN